MDTLNHQFYIVKGKVMHKLSISNISRREQQNTRTWAGKAVAAALEKQ